MASSKRWKNSAIKTILISYPMALQVAKRLDALIRNKLTAPNKSATILSKNLRAASPQAKHDSTNNTQNTKCLEPAESGQSHGCQKKTPTQLN